LSFPHGVLNTVEFIAISGQKARVRLPAGHEKEIAIKRSVFDDLLLSRARELGAEVHEESIVTALIRTASANPRANGFATWRIDIVNQMFAARFLVGADGRNSTVARLRNLLPRLERERIALQAHIPLPKNFGERVVLQFLPEGYSGQAPVSDDELNLCLVGKPPTISSLKTWAENEFKIPPDQVWRTITPLTRDAVAPAHGNLLFIGDAARVVEPFTGEGIYYALRSGELAANAIVKISRGENPELTLREFAGAHASMYRGRLWINRLARAAVLSPRFASALLRVPAVGATILRMLTNQIAGSGD
jgi:flavin-dependent dehydrogenase